MTTAAGTVPPAVALVVGAGVAGLQAVATLKRMGAVVYVTDVRPEVKEQAESLGAVYLNEQENRSDKTALEKLLPRTDILITTVPTAAKTGPLVSEAMLAQLAPCAVVIDLFGTNVAPRTARKDLTVIRSRYFAADVAQSASRMLSRNIFNLIDSYGEKLRDLRFSDVILDAVRLTKI
jgi:NAD(P) transhydrogenase subunit alpha